jgi:hypothetical protein
MINIADNIAKEAYLYFVLENKNIIFKSKDWNDLSINERKMWRKISDFVIENKHQGSVKLAPFIYDFYIKNNKKWFNKSWFKLNQYEKDIWTNIVYTIAFKKYQFDKFRL